MVTQSLKQTHVISGLVECGRKLRVEHSHRSTAGQESAGAFENARVEPPDKTWQMLRFAAKHCATAETSLNNEFRRCAKSCQGSTVRIGC